MDKRFLPVSFKEGKQHYKDFSQFDVVFVTGDPYYDHPLSVIAIIARLLDKKGYKAGIIAQPSSDEDYKSCGKPKYFFCITSGLLDSWKKTLWMTTASYTAATKNLYTMILRY